MESTIYPQSPLAEYLEAQGEASQDWQRVENDTKSQSSSTPSFAPRGPPRPLRSRFQNLITPLQTKGDQRTMGWTALHGLCSAAISAGVSMPENERFLDQFRYTIIASQLLTYEAKPPAETEVADSLSQDEISVRHAAHPFSLQGAGVALTLSFLTAWILHWCSTLSPGFAIHWLSLCGMMIPLLIMAVVVYGYAGKKSLQRVRRMAVEALSDLISQSQSLDNLARSAVGLIQEVEIVSRGYEISNPLPPITRLELKGPGRRCLTLRTGVARAISSVIRRYLEAHNAMLPLVDTVNMQRYHDIYDLSRQDYEATVQEVPSPFEDDPESLRALKTSLMRLFVARQIFLCDLLALTSESSTSDLTRWSTISNEIQNLPRVVLASATIIRQLLNDEGNRQWGLRLETQCRESTQLDENQTCDVQTPSTPRKEKVEGQLRRLDALSQSIRSLNARMSLMRDEANNLMEDGAQSPDVSSLLSRQYDMIGNDLKNITSEWDRAGRTMLVSTALGHRSSLSTCSSGGPRSPHSPVHSLGGSTAANEGSPVAALKRLSGESFKNFPSIDGLGSEEEFFEAVSLSPKHKRMSMTREEKVAKMQEDRRKRATLQENRDVTTNMLRELETVIKHRPRGKTTSRVAGV